MAKIFRSLWTFEISSTFYSIVFLCWGNKVFCYFNVIWLLTEIVVDSIKFFFLSGYIHAHQQQPSKYKVSYEQIHTAHALLVQSRTSQSAAAQLPNSSGRLTLAPGHYILYPFRKLSPSTHKLGVFLSLYARKSTAHTREYMVVTHRRPSSRRVDNPRRERRGYIP